MNWFPLSTWVHFGTTPQGLDPFKVQVSVVDIRGDGVFMRDEVEYRFSALMVKPSYGACLARQFHVVALSPVLFTMLIVQGGSHLNAFAALI